MCSAESVELVNFATEEQPVGNLYMQHQKRLSKSNCIAVPSLAKRCVHVCQCAQSTNVLHGGVLVCLYCSTYPYSTGVVRIHIRVQYCTKPLPI